MFTCAKGISGSLPISAVVGRRDILDLYAPNTMTSTHSGSPLAAAAANASIKYMVDHELDKEAERKGKFMQEKLEELQKKFPHRIGYVGGMGMARACTFTKGGYRCEGDPDFALLVTNKCIEKGLLFFAAVGAGITMKLVPPLIMPDDMLAEGMAVYAEAVAEADAEMQ
jgi:4-aminobutyrate aminotransferase-like enzyme